MQTEKEKKDAVVDTNPNEAPMKTTPPWRQEEAPSKRHRIWQYVGVVDKWLKPRNFGFARFEGFNEAAIIHVNDIDRIPTSGDRIECNLERRPDGKLRATNVIVVAAKNDDAAKHVENDAEKMESFDLEQIHDALMGESEGMR